LNRQVFTPSPPPSLAGRLLWVGVRLLLWLVLFVALSVAGSLVYPPVQIGGASALLASSVSLVAAVLTGIILLRVMDKREPAALGFGLGRRQVKLFGAGVALGAAVLLVVAALMALPGWLTFRSDSGDFTGWAVTLLRDFGLLGIAAAAEEAIFRGYPFQALARGFGALPAIAAGSIIFAWAHGANPNVGGFALANIFLAGVMLSAAYLVTRSLWYATAIHVGWNWAMASLVDLPVSGLEIMDTPLYEPIVDGPVWFTGGAFGPEGGVAGTIAFALALAAIWRFGGKRWPPALEPVRAPVNADQTDHLNVSRFG
jgi:membrane protease YdiL (CAAX protease family)